MAAPVYVTGNVPSAAEVNSWFVNVLFAIKTSDTGRNTTTTPTDDPHLTIPVAANATYHIHVVLFHNSQPAGDLKYTFVGPASSVFSYAGATVTLNGSLAIDDNEFYSDMGDLQSSGGIAGVWVPVTIQGMLITAGTAGNFKLQWAQWTSNAGNSTLKTNSFISARRVA
jgi:hypothetical protein